MTADKLRSVTISFNYRGKLSKNRLRQALLRLLAKLDGVEPDKINVHYPKVDIDSVQEAEATEKK